MRQLGFDLGESASKQEDVEQVMQELCVKCSDCRLSLIHPFNRGMIYRGNVFGRIAIIVSPGGCRDREGSGHDRT